MLNNIANINPNSEYKNSLKKENSSKKTGSRTGKKESQHDGASLSPAISFLNKIKWKLFELKEISKDKINFKFGIDDLEFTLVIDLPGICTLTEISLKVKNPLSGEMPDNSTSADFLTLLQPGDEWTDNPEYQLKGLKLFFEELADFRSNLSQTDYNSYFQILLDRYNNHIEEDFIYINSHIKIFLEKLLEIKIIPQTSLIKELPFFRVRL